MSIYPQNDQYMEYDRAQHRYVLTKKAVFDLLGENLDTYFPPQQDVNQSTRAARLLKGVSNDVYDYLAQGCLNSAWQTYELAKTPFLRARIQRMLLSQVEYLLTNGAPHKYAGINIAKGTAMDIDALRGRAKVSDTVEILANEIVPELGRSLKYTAWFGKRCTPDYEEGDY